MAFHVLIVLQIIPYTIVWAGKLNSLNDMYKFEIVSLSINFILLSVLLLKAEYIKSKIPPIVLNVIIWIFIVLFSLNTIGNLMAENMWEKIIFTPLTLTFAILLFLIVKKQKG